MVIVNQMINNDLPLSLQTDYCTIINTKTKGLSISRNLALNEVKSGYAIVADDDVVYENDFEKLIRHSFKSNPTCDVLTFQIRTPEGPKYKIYPPKSYWHNKFSVLKVSSISIALKIDSVNISGCQFDTNFGLGAKFSSNRFAKKRFKNQIYS